jgi:signal transduction histidine kinase
MKLIIDKTQAIKNLQLRYILALSIIAILTLVSQVIIQYTIYKGSDDSRIVNIAGRQRMLSQRISKTALAIKFSKDVKDRIKYQYEMKKSAGIWKQSHNGLIFGDTTLGLPGKNSDKVKSMFESLEIKYKEIIKSVDSIQTIKFDKQNDKTENLLDNSIQAILKYEPNFLKEMDAIVFQYDAEAKGKISIIRYLEIGILIITFIVLFLEAAFIFRPLEKSLLATFVAFHESEAKLKDTVAVKDKFFSIVAHDIRSPFSGFLGLTDLMAKEADELTKEEIKTMSFAINKSATAVFNLIEDLLLWSRTQTGSMPFIPELLDLYEISSNTMISLKETSKNKNIELVNNIKPITYITGDRNMVRTIVSNLFSNAIKFTPTGGKVEIGTMIQPSEGLKPSEGSVVIYIKDNGIGMDKDTISKLFRIDVNVTNLGTSGEKGTGLGLILCKEFVEKHNGKIWVESEVGKGSTFYFSLPNTVESL